MLWGPLAVEDRPIRLGKRLPTSLTAISLYPFACLAISLNVPLLIILKLAVIRTGFIRTEIPWLPKLLHLFPSLELAYL